MVDKTQFPPKPKDVFPVDTFLIANVSAPPKRASSSEVRQRLRDEVDLVEPKEHEQSLVYANMKGHTLSDMLSDMRKEIEKSHRERAEHKTILDNHEHQFEIYRTTVDGHGSQLEELRAGHESQLEELRAKILDLSKISQGYFDVRKRFLAVYQRDRGNLNPFQYQEITDGNRRAHSGDAAVDAELYRNAGRSDGAVFQELYGVQFERVGNLVDEVNDRRVDGKVFHILNTRGTQVANGNKFPNELEDAFTSYLNEVYKESEERASYKSSDQVHPYKSINDVAGRARTFWHLYWQFENSPQGMES